ncbi:MAG: cytochrome P450 [Actinomycetota bacterium]
MRAEQVLIPLIRKVAARPRVAGALLGRDRWGNPLDPTVMADPYVAIDRQIADGPIAYRRLYQQWFVLGYDEAREILHHDDVIASGQIEMLLHVRPYSQMGDRARFLFRHLLPIVDPPTHTRLRALVSRAFSPRRIGDLESAVERMANDLLDALPADGPIDLHAGFVVPLPVNVIATLLGVPEEQWPWVHQVTQVVIKLFDPFIDFDPAEIDAAVEDLFATYGAMADDRRRRPGDDLISTIVTKGDDGDELGPDELIAMIATLLGAGFETTGGLLATAVSALDRFPDQRELLLADPDRWPNAIEELLRFDTPVKMLGRQAARDLHIGDTRIPAGANIVVSLVAAHRDRRHYADPHTLRLDREDPHPLAFGHGMHYCLGAALARMEARVGLRALLERHPGYSIPDGGIEWRPSAVLRSPSRLVIETN